MWLFGLCITVSVVSWPHIRGKNYTAADALVISPLIGAVMWGTVNHFTLKRSYNKMISILNEKDTAYAIPGYGGKRGAKKE